MDESKVRSIVKANINRLKKKLGLRDWNIDIIYGDCDGNPAMCVCDIDYKIIEITLDPIHISNEAGVLHTLKHELVHGFTASFQTYRESVKCFLTDKEINSTNVIFRRAEEEITCAIVRVLEDKNES